MSRTIPHPYIPGCVRVIHDHEPLPRPVEYGAPGHASEESRFEDDEPTYEELNAAAWREECRMRREHS